MWHEGAAPAAPGVRERADHKLAIKGDAVLRASYFCYVRPGDAAPGEVG